MVIEAFQRNINSKLHLIKNYGKMKDLLNQYENIVDLLLLVIEYYEEEYVPYETLSMHAESLTQTRHMLMTFVEEEAEGM